MERVKTPGPVVFFARHPSFFFQRRSQLPAAFLESFPPANNPPWFLPPRRSSPRKTNAGGCLTQFPATSNGSFFPPLLLFPPTVSSLFVLLLSPCVGLMKPSLHCCVFFIVYPAVNSHIYPCEGPCDSSGDPPCHQPPWPGWQWAVGVP